jgi:hypothetical protein
MSEDDAYKHIQRLSMNNRRTMREIADAILLTHQGLTEGQRQRPSEQARDEDGERQHQQQDDHREGDRKDEAAAELEAIPNGEVHPLGLQPRRLANVRGEPQRLLLERGEELLRIPFGALR